MTMKRQTWAFYTPADGLGGSAGAATVPAGDTDPILEEPGYLTGGGEFEPDPGDGPAVDDDPWAGVPDAIRAAAEAKGIKSPEDFARSFQEAQSLIGRRDEERLTAQQERDLLASQLAALQQGTAPASGSPDPNQEWTVDFEALSAAAGDDPIQAMKLYHENVVPQLLRDFGAQMLTAVNQDVETRIAPVSAHVSQTMLKDQALELSRTYGQDFAKHREEVIRLVSSRPEYRDNPRGLTLAFHELLARDRAAELAAARGQEGESLTGGRNPRGGANRPVRDVAAETRAAIESAIGGLAGKDGLS